MSNYFRDELVDMTQFTVVEQPIILLFSLVDNRATVLSSDAQLVSHRVRFPSPWFERRLNSGALFSVTLSDIHTTLHSEPPEYNQSISDAGWVPCSRLLQESATTAAQFSFPSVSYPIKQEMPRLASYFGEETRRGGGSSGGGSELPERHWWRLCLKSK